MGFKMQIKGNYLTYSLCFYLLAITGPVSSTRRCLDIDEHKIRTDNLPPCVKPIENLLNGRFKPGLFGELAMPVPPWLNATLATIGQKFARNNWFSVNIAMVMAELVVGAQRDTSEVLFHHGQVYKLEQAIKRFTANILQDSVWYKEDMFSDLSNIAESLTKVRTMHLLILSKSPAQPQETHQNVFKVSDNVWSAVQRDLAESNIENRVIPPRGTAPTEYQLNQFSMASTLWGLSAMPLIRAKEFGIPIASDEELEGFLHFWAFIGYGVGIEDEYNVCMQPNAKSAKVYFTRMLDELMVPFMFDLGYASKVMIESGSKGFTKAIGPIAQFGFILRRMLEDVIGIPCPNLIANLTPMGRTTDGLYRRVLKPAIFHSKASRGVVNIVYEGYIQNLSKKIFGFSGVNKTLVAEKAFSW